jgi:hypothetical protein
MTHTFAVLDVSKPVFDEIAAKLRDAGYDHAFVDRYLDMHGIALERAETRDDVQAEVDYFDANLPRFAASLSNLASTASDLKPTSFGLAPATTKQIAALEDILKRFGP